MACNNNRVPAVIKVPAVGLYILHVQVEVQPYQYKRRGYPTVENPIQSICLQLVRKAEVLRLHTN